MASEHGFATNPAISEPNGPANSSSELGLEHALGDEPTRPPAIPSESDISKKPEIDERFNILELSPINNPETFVRSIIRKRFSYAQSRHHIPLKELEHEGMVAHYVGLSKLAQDCLGIAPLSSWISKEGVDKLNAELQSDPAKAEYLQDTLKNNGSVKYLWVTIWGSLLDYVGSTYRNKSGEIPFSQLGPNESEEDDRKFEDRLVDTTVLPEELAGQKDEYERLLASAHDVLLQNRREGQGKRDWFVFNEWVNGKQPKEIAVETDWLKSEDSAEKALERIVQLLREKLGGEVNSGIHLQETHLNRGERTYNQKKRFREWYAGLSDEQKAGILERKRLATAERRRIAKEAKTKQFKDLTGFETTNETE